MLVVDQCGLLLLLLMELLQLQLLLNVLRMHLVLLLVRHQGAAGHPGRMHANKWEGTRCEWWRQRHGMRELLLLLLQGMSAVIVAVSCIGARRVGAVVVWQNCLDALPFGPLFRRHILRLARCKATATAIATSSSR